MNNTVKPFVKWLGGKRRVLPELRKFYPQEYNTYHEPFLGGGSVMLDVAPENGIVSDMNSELINTYITVKENPEKLLDLLVDHQNAHSKEHYLEVRGWDRDTSFQLRSSVEKAARFIYLNKTGFNGLHRVNRNNQNNVPFGSYNNPLIADFTNIEAYSEWLRNSKIVFKAETFTDALKRVKGEKNFVYLDPPYIPLTATANFVGYASEGFGLDKQEELRDAFMKMDAENNFVLSSNSDTPLTRKLYADAEIVPINVLRSVGRSADSRVKVGEVIIVSKSLKKFLNL